MSDIKGNKLRVLAKKEYKRALLGVVPDATDDADTDKITVAELAEISQYENPLKITTERVDLASYSTSDYAINGSHVRSTAETPNALDTNKRFDDGYYLIEFEFFYSFRISGTTYEFTVPFLIPIAYWENTENMNRYVFNNPRRLYYPPYQVADEIAAWRISDTSFGIAGAPRTTYSYLRSLYGHKMKTEITTP